MAAAPRGSSTRIRWALLIAGALAGCEEVAVTAIRVDAGLVESTITSVEAGVVEPRQKANLAPPVAGRIMRIHCAEGERVEAGQVIIELENQLEKLRLDEAERALKRLTEMGPIATDEEKERADFAYRRAKTDYERTLIQALFTGFIAELNARLGEMTYGSLSAAFGGAGRGMGGEPLAYLVDDSKLFVEAEIDEADVFRARIGQPASVHIGGTESRRIEGRVSSIAQHVSTKEGESRTAKVRVELLRKDPGTREESGAPGSIAPGPGGAGSGGVDPEGSEPYPPENGSGSSHSPGWNGVLVGMSADVEILVDRVENAIRVPTNVVLERGEAKHVFVVKGDKLERRAITVGIGNWAMTEVKQGLSPGELVVVPADTKTLEEGRTVKVIEDDPSGP